MSVAFSSGGGVAECTELKIAARHLGKLKIMPDLTFLSINGTPLVVNNSVSLV